MSNINNSGVRDYSSNRSFGNGLGAASAVSVISLVNDSNADFTPVPNAVHAITPTAARTLTLLQATASKSNLRIGEGFVFYIKNNSAGAFSVTLVAGGGVEVATEGTSTLVVAQGETGTFVLNRTSESVHSISCLGIVSH